MTVDASRAGREQRRRTAAAAARKPNLAKYYGRVLPPVAPGEFEFGLELLRGSGFKAVELTTGESFGWNDEESVLNGSVVLHRPDPSDWKSLPIGRGHRIRCRVRWGRSWYELWTMRADEPQIAVETGIVTVPLKDDLDGARRGGRHWVYRASKARPHGWFGHDALRDAARKEGVRVGAIAKCRHRRAKIDVQGSLLDLAIEIYSHERTVAGRKFVVRMRDGRLEVVTYRRNRALYVLGSQLRSAALEAKPAVANPVTVLTGRARIGKGRKAQKITHTESNPDVVARYGYSRKVRDYGRVSSASVLADRVRRDLARQLRAPMSGTVQTQGIPFIRRGDGLQVLLSSDRLDGARSYVYATAVRHTVQGAVYTTELDFTQTDPFEADRLAREKAVRAAARSARAKRRRSSG